MANPKDRSVVLDVLRAVAVFLVMGRHLELCPSELNPTLHNVTAFWKRGGWMGVDLFFVLSGFLVSGLLFKEHFIHGEIRLKRFFFRRGLKIYPAFLFFMFGASAWFHFSGGHIGPRRFLVEIAFLQNYLPGIWFHTWSLAVEEHFYLLLPLVLVPILKRERRDPVPILFLVFLALTIGCFAARALGDGNEVYDFRRHTAPTHKRIDALFVGVLLSAVFHYRRATLTAFVERFRSAMLATSLVLLSIPFFFPLETTPWVYQIGYTLIDCGAALILAVAVTSKDFGHWFWRGVARIGMDSYSIYLWHAAAILVVAEPLRRRFPGTLNWYVFAVIYFTASLALGICMSKLVEWPVLRLRDKYFPSRSKTDPANNGRSRESPKGPETATAV